MRHSVKSLTEVNVCYCYWMLVLNRYRPHFCLILPWLWRIKTFETVFQKVRHQTHGVNSVKSEPIFSVLSLADSPVNLQLRDYYKDPTTCCYTTLCNICVLEIVVVKNWLKQFGRARLELPCKTQPLNIVVVLEWGPMPDVMAALPNIGGALCSTPQSMADAHY